MFRQEGGGEAQKDRKLMNRGKRISCEEERFVMRLVRRKIKDQVSKRRQVDK